MSIDGVARELLVRYLDTWTPTALHSARGATFVQVWAAAPDAETAEAALRVFAEFSDRLRGRRLTVILLSPAAQSHKDAARAVQSLKDATTALQTELNTPPELTVHVVEGVDKLINPHQFESIAVALAVLGLAIALEAVSFRTAVVQAAAVTRNISLGLPAVTARSRSPST